MGEERTAVRCPVHTNCVVILTTSPKGELVGRTALALPRQYAALAWLNAIDGCVIDMVHEAPAVPGLSLADYLRVPPEIRRSLTHAGASLAALLDEDRALAERIEQLRVWTDAAFDTVQRSDLAAQSLVPAEAEQVGDGAQIVAPNPKVWTPPPERLDPLAIPVVRPHKWRRPRRGVTTRP